MNGEEGWRYKVRVGYARITDSRMQPGRNSMQSRTSVDGDLRDALTAFEVGENVVIVTEKDFTRLWKTAQFVWSEKAL